MSHGNETPRQKMINLMYLVLTCLLALNVSRDVLLGFVNINESIESTNTNFKVATDKLLEAAEEAIAQGHGEIRPYLQRSKEVCELTKKTIVYIDSLKKEVIRYTENKDGADTLSLAETEKLDDYDRPTFLLLGDDELQPRAGKYGARELRTKLIDLSDTLLNVLNTMQTVNGQKLPKKEYEALKGRLSLFRPAPTYKDLEGKAVSWEMHQFYNLPMAAVVTQLSRVQSELQNIQAEMVSAFSSAAGKLAIHFNRMEARIVPQSHYVQTGSAFLANVFLGASSTMFTEDNLQFVLGDMDTSTGVLAPGSRVLPMKDGNAAIELPTASIGHQHVKGWIRLREGTGAYKYFPYENDYVVAEAAVAVSPEKMNVFYAGVENPVNVSAAGVAPGDLEVKIEGASGRITPNGNGKYNVRVTGAGQTTITVFQRTAEGLKRQGLPQVFRVKKLPSPPIKIMGRVINGSADFSLAEAQSISQLILDLSNYDFSAPFIIKSFGITMGGGGQGFQMFTCKDGVLSDEAQRAMRRLKRGAKIYFEDIKVDAPDGQRELPMVKISVK
jgi:gliding motility-associated protein GldM